LFYVVFGYKLDKMSKGGYWKSRRLGIDKEKLRSNRNINIIFYSSYTLVTIILTYS
jgi:hypothetical protein